MIRLLYPLSLLLVVSACQQSVRRAALVPHQQPIRRSGQPVGDNAHELSLGSPVLARLEQPRESDEEAGVVIPRWHITGEWHMRAENPDLDFGVVWDHGLKKNAGRVDDDYPLPEHGDVYGGGVNAHYSALLSPGFRLGIGAELIFYSVPFIEYRTCTDVICLNPGTDIDRERDTIPVLSVGLIPSARVTHFLSVFAGANLRNHPTIKRGDVESSLEDDGDSVDEGGLAAVLTAGVEFHLPSGMRALLYGYQPSGVVDYAPTFGAAITIPLARRSATPTQTSAYPTQPPGQPPGAPPPPPGAPGSPY